MNQCSIIVLAPLAVLLTLSGCDVDQQTLDSLQSAVANASANGQVSGADSLSSQPGPLLSEVGFKPLHPNRVDPFNFPEGADVSSPREGTTNSLTTAAQVEVLGFANVGTQHVLLKSGDRTRSLKAGESLDGVRVIAINPPMVQLQMGTLIWNATMFDKSDQR